jgi:ligand-binding sensor domain-containing protein/signal transduction histidine kinase
MRPYILLLFILVQVQLVPLLAVSQKQFIKFDHLQTDEGLSQSNVLCILQDSRGFMWFGTEEGLNKYDGYSFTVYKNDPQKSNSLSDNYVNDIVEDENGDLWIGTLDGGLNKYDRQKDRFIRFQQDPKNPNSISDNYVGCVRKDSKGNIWAGTSSGVNIFDRKHNRFIKYARNERDKNSLSDNSVLTIYEDKQHNIWVGTAAGLNLFNPEKKSFTRFLHNANDPESIGGNTVNSIFEDSKHRLWIGTTGGGLNLFDRQTGKFRSLKKNNTKFPGIADNTIFSITEDDLGMIWIGSENNGISVLNPQTETFTNYVYNDADNTGLNSNSIQRIYKDRKGNIWIGTFNSGINFLSHDIGTFTHYQHNASINSLANNKVLGIYGNSANNIWIATDGGGLDLYNTNTGDFKHYKHQEGNNNTISGSNILSVLEDSYQNVWVGTYGNGVDVINEKQNFYKHYKNDASDPNSLASNNGWVIFEDKEKNIWIGTDNGVSRYDRAKDGFIQYKEGKGQLSSNGITSIYEDSDGFIWIGTNSYGINRLDKKTNKIVQFTYNENRNSLSSSKITAFCEDKNRNLWIGTFKGLNCLDKKTNLFTSYGIKDGLPNEKIAGILQDDKGNLWISTGKGLSKFNPVTKAFNNFGVSHGLQGNEFKPAYFKARSGAMYFGGNNGFNEFFPDSIRESSFDPPLVITDFLIFNKSVPIAGAKNGSSPLNKNITETKAIAIPYSSSVISFEFASLNYTTPERKQYAYKLDGFDDDWNYVGIKHTATYTNLDPGTYIFKAKALNDNGEWSSQVVEMKLTITPPFWLTWWFKILAAIAISGCIMSFYSYRTKAIKAQKQKLQKQVNEQTHQLLHSAEEERKAREESERARYEEEKAKNEAHDANKNLEKKNKELEQFAYIASHDLQEPLRTTSGFIELLKKQYGGKLDERADSYFNYITDASERMKLLIKNLLDYSRIGAKKELEEVDCNKTLRDVLADLGAAINDAKADVQHKTLPVVSGYPTELKQLFQNLIINAVKFRKKGVDPQIKISAAQINDTWEFAFADNGIGIEKQHSEKIFNIFQRLHTRTEYEGSGIGLAHCKKIAELHKGRIWVESEPGIGTTFYFTIPQSNN